MKASLDAGKVVTLPNVETIADGTAVKTPGDKIFPYIQKNIDEIIAVEDEELIVNFLDILENHKMLVENSGLLTVAALKHLDCKGKRVVSILSGGNMDIITLSSVVQHGLIARGRVFTVAVQLPDRPGELVNVADIIAKEKGNVIRLEHNQFVSINRNAAVELRITLEAFGQEHKNEILKALRDKGYERKRRDTDRYVLERNGCFMAGTENTKASELLHTPGGVRDIYGSACARKLEVQHSLEQVMHSYGFRNVQTPTFEYFDIFNKERGTAASNEMFKFFDRGNNTLVLRPDMTPAIARCVAKYFREETEQMRFCYTAQTFVSTGQYKGKLQEVTQVGAELFMDDSSDADAEMLALTIECLLESGLKEFQIEVGHADLFRAW